MRSEKNEFLSLLCKLYMTALLVALPLYTGEGYWNLGDTKYMLFRNVSFLCLGLWLPAWISGRIWTEARRLRDGRGKEDGAVGRRVSVSAMDLAMAAYCLIVLLSALFSDYGRLAWEGYEGWYMGAVSQLLLAGIYFFVSRQYDGARWPLYLGEAALFLVTALGLLHRLGIDPLKLLIYWNPTNWEYSHMLSTLGNINWLCGYYSVAISFLTVHFLREERLWLKGLLYLGTVLSFVLLGVQGSQGGLLILAVCVGGCLLLGYGRGGVAKKVCALMAGFCLCMPLMELLMKLRGDKAAVVADGNVFHYVKWPMWLAAALIWGALYGFLALRKGTVRRRLKRGVIRAVLAGAAVLAVLAVIFFAAGYGIDDSFGSGRGFLWRIAGEWFGQADIREKLLGAGPDCYAEAVFGRIGAGVDVWKGEHWEGAVFTNAHNEFLSQLCNIGILGTACYLGIFLIGLQRYGDGCRQDDGGPVCSDLWAGLLAIAMYGAHSLISFQQVLNAPLLFLALGICEQRMRAQGDRRRSGPGQAHKPMKAPAKP